MVHQLQVYGWSLIFKKSDQPIQIMADTDKK